jgi:hypothetical protein
MNGHSIKTRINFAFETHAEALQSRPDSVTIGRGTASAEEKLD